MAKGDEGGAATVQVVHHDEVALEQFPGGASYRTLIGDDAAGKSDEVRIGIQSSPPGYATPLHSHPYTEILTILEGEGVAWIEGGADEIALAPGMTVVLPANLPHAFRATGDTPLVTYGLHVSPDRVVHIHDDSPPESGHPK
jgi:quercetin dioxygenase-like cupin family protein